jgi:hypothetical protein
LTAAFDLARSLGARSVSMPTLATGYGPLSIADFARALAASLVGRSDPDALSVVVRNLGNSETISSILAQSRQNA